MAILLKWKHKLTERVGNTRKRSRRLDRVPRWRQFIRFIRFVEFIGQFCRLSGGIVGPNRARLDHARHVALSQQSIGQSVGLVLDHVALFDIAGLAGLALDGIADGLIQPFVQLGDEKGSAGLIQGKAAGNGFEVILLHAAAGEEKNRGPVCENSEGFNEVIHKRFFVVVVSVQKTDEGIETGENAGFFHERVEDAVAVVDMALNSSWAG